VQGWKAASAVHSLYSGRVPPQAGAAVVENDYSSEVQYTQFLSMKWGCAKTLCISFSVTKQAFFWSKTSTRLGNMTDWRRQRRSDGAFQEIKALLVRLGRLATRFYRLLQEVWWGSQATKTPQTRKVGEGTQWLAGIPSGASVGDSLAPHKIWIVIANGQHRSTTTFANGELGRN